MKQSPFFYSNHLQHQTNDSSHVHTHESCKSLFSSCSPLPWPPMQTFNSVFNISVYMFISSYKIMRKKINLYYQPFPGSSRIKPRGFMSSSPIAHMPTHASNSDHANFSLRYFLIYLDQLFIQSHLHLSARRMYFIKGN